MLTNKFDKKVKISLEKYRNSLSASSKIPAVLSQRAALSSQQTALSSQQATLSSQQTALSSQQPALSSASSSKPSALQVQTYAFKTAQKKIASKKTHSAIRPPPLSSASSASSASSTSSTSSALSALSASASANVTFDQAWKKRTIAAFLNDKECWLTTMKSSPTHWLKIYAAMSRKKRKFLNNCRDNAISEDTYLGADGAVIHIRVIGLIDNLACIGEICNTIYMHDGTTIKRDTSITMHIDDIRNLYKLGTEPQICVCKSHKEVFALGIQLGDIFQGTLRFMPQQRLRSGKIVPAKWKVKYGVLRKRGKNNKISNDTRIGLLYYCRRCDNRHIPYYYNH